MSTFLRGSVAWLIVVLGLGLSGTAFAFVSGTVTSPQGAVSGVTVTLVPGPLANTSQLPDDIAASFSTSSLVAVDFPDTSGNPFASIWPAGPTDYVAASFSVTFESDEGGYYNFWLGSDDGGVLIVDGVERINNDGVHPYATGVASIFLGPGNHTVVVKYFEGAGTAGVRVEWSYDDTFGGLGSFGLTLMDQGDAPGVLGIENRCGYWSASFWALPTATLTTTSSVIGAFSFAGASAKQPMTLTPSRPNSTLTPASSTATGATFTLSDSPPEISDVANRTTTEDAFIDVTFSVLDFQTAAAGLTMSASASSGLVLPANVTFTGSGVNRTARVVPTPNGNGTTTVTLTVTDGHARTVSDSFVLTVNPVNDAPVARPDTSRPADQKIRISGFGQIAPTNEVTIEFWQLTTAQVDQSTFILTADDAARRISAHVPWGSGTVFWDWGNILGAGTGRLTYTPGSTLVGLWAHFALVASESGNYMKIFRDGVEVSSKTGMTPFVRRDGDLWLDPVGRLADFRVWNVARSAAQIAENFRAPVPPASAGLILNYRFEGSSGTTIRDWASSTTDPAQEGAQNGTVMSGAMYWTNFESLLAGNLGIQATEDSPRLIFLPGFDDETASPIYSGVTASSGTLTAVGGGLFLYRPPVGQSFPFGSPVINYVVGDGSVTASGSLKLQVNAVNDPPVVGPGTALSFDGGSQHLDLPDGTWFGNTFTVEGWVFVRSYANWSRLFDFGNGMGVDNVLGALSESASGRPVFHLYRGASVQAVSSSQTIPLNTWTHLAFTRDSGGTGHIFLNGVDVASGPIHAPVALTRTNNYFGRSNWPDANANAKFAELRIWNVARTAQQLNETRHASLTNNAPGLVVVYHLNEGSGLTAFDAATGDGAQNATLVDGPTWQPVDGPAMSLVLNGTTQYSRTSDSASVSLTGPLTVEAWVRPDEVNREMGLVEKYDVNQGGYFLRLNASGNVVFGTADGATAATQSTVTSVTRLAAGVWSHVAGQWDGLQLRVYVNGVLDGTSGVVVRNPKNGSTPLVLGARGADPFDFRFSGRLADVRLWNGARTAAEIADWRGGVPTNAPGLTVNYRFGEGSGSTLVDLAGGEGAQNATLIGSPTWNLAEANLPNLQLVKYTEEVPQDVVLPAFDIETASLTYSAFSSSTGAVAQASGSRFRYTPPAGYNGPATITYSAGDGTTTRSATVYLQGIAVEDAPTLDDTDAVTLGIGPQIIGEGSGQATLNLKVTDGDPELSQTVNLTATSSDPTLVRVVSIAMTGGETAQLLYRPRAGRSGVVVITVTVTEPGSGLVTSQSFNVTVEPVDDPPNVGPATSLASNGANFTRIPGFGTNAPTDEITIEFWQYANGVTAQSMFSMNNGGGTNRVLAHVPWSSGQVIWDFGNIDTLGRLVYTPPVPITNSWQHFAFVASKSGNYMKIFRNGIEEATKPGMVSFVPLVSDFTLGMFAGQIAEFRVWKVARLGPEIEAAMHASLPNDSPNLVVYYRFNQKPTVGVTDFASLPDQGGSQNGELVADAGDVDPVWNFTTGTPAWQTSVAELQARQVVRLPEGTSTNVFLPAWDAENGLGLTWLDASASTGSVAQSSGGLWIYSAPATYDGPAVVTYRVKDSANHTNTGSINLRVVFAANNAPTIGAIANVAAEEDSAVIEVPFTVDDDQAPSSLTITVVLLANAELIQSKSVSPGGNFRTLGLVPRPGEIGTVRVRILVSDAGGKSAQTEFDLRIEPKPAFSVFDLGAIQGKAASFGTAINDRGAVAGYMTDTADLESNPIAFLFRGIENEGVPDENSNPPVQVGPEPLASPFRAWAINNRYAIAGAGKSAAGTNAWFKDIQEPEVDDLGRLASGTVAEVRALNDAGYAAGFGRVTGGKKRAFLFTPGAGALTDLGTAPAPFHDASDAFALNASQHVVGSVYATNGARRAMFHKGGVMLPLFNVPEDTNSVALGVNAFDQVVGAATTFAVGDSALSFDGVDAAVILTNLLTNPNPGTPLVAGNAAHTVEAWIMVRALPPTRSWPLLLGNAGTGSQHWLVNNAAGGGNLKLGFFSLAGSTNVPLTLGAWMHVATTWDPPSSKFVVYVNGTPFGTNIITGVNLQGIPLQLGRVQAAENFFDGGLDEVRVWRTTRTGNEIAANYTRRLTGTETGLVAYLPFDEGSGTLQTTSLAAGHLVGTLAGSPEWTVRGGLPSPELTVSDPVLQLDGASSYALLPSLMLSNVSFTVEFRARHAESGVDDIALSQGTGADNQGLHVGFRPNNKFTFAFWANDLNTVDAFPDLDWHHWACTLNVTNSARRIYRDGVLVGQDVVPNAYRGTGPIRLGHAPFLGTSWFKGLIDDVRIWGVVRSGEEIAANLSSRLPGNTPGLLSSYTFDEGGGNTAENRVPGRGSASFQGASGWAGRDSGTSRAFFYDMTSGRLKSLGTVPEGGASEAEAINDFGQIAGTAAKGTGRRAFFYSAGRLNDLNALLPEDQELDQWTLESAHGINRSGAIVGSGRHGVFTRAYLALPATVIGRPVIRPEGAVDRAPLVTILKKHMIDDDALNSFHWSSGDSKLYAIRPVTARIDWFTSFKDTEGEGDALTSNTNRIVSVTVNVWPRQPIIHVAGAPVDLQPALTGANYTFQYLIYSTNGASVEPSAKVFTCSQYGYSVVYYLKTDGQPVNPKTQRPFFEVVRTVPWTDSHAGLATVGWTIGSEVVDPGHREYDGKNGYVLFENAAIDSTGANRAYNRGSRTGSILPVNTERPGGNIDANPDPLVVVWYRTNRIGVAWASVPVKYSLDWPADDVVDRIVIASQLGSGYLGAADYPDKGVYNQPDPALPGFNPNEEHAYLPVDTLYALRNDLNEPNQFSKPYALLKYRDPATGRWRMRVFQVIGEQAPYFFNYSGTVGKEIQPPLPLSLMPLCGSSYPYPGNSEVGWEDHQGKLYARQAGPEGTHTNLVVRWFYPMQPGFYHPDATVGVGDCVAWLDRRPAGALGSPNAATGVHDRPIDVTYDIRWDDPHVLQIGETLLHSKHGLPDVFNMANARVIFDSLNASAPGGFYTNGTTGADLITGLTRFYDPLSPRTLTSGVAIPASIKRQNIAGREYFTDLPWMLKVRLTYDPVNQWLSFAGHLDEKFGVGEPLLLPNVLSTRERDRLEDLAPGDGAWSDLMDRLYDLTRNPNQVDLLPFDLAPDKALRVGLLMQTITNFFEITGDRRFVKHTPAVIFYGAFGHQTVIRPAFDTTIYVGEAHRPSTIEEARRIDDQLAEDVRKGDFRPFPAGPLKSSFLIATNVLPEVFGAGPKALTAGIGGIPPSPTRPGNSLAFDGTGGYVTVGSNDGLPINLSGSPFTIEFWAKVTTPATEQYLVGQPGGTADFGQLRIGFRAGGKFVFDLGTTPASLSIFSTSDLYLDTDWHHWACVFDPESKIQTICRDGVVVESRTHPNLSYSGFGTIEFGRFGAQYFGGQLDEIRIWKTARTPAEIRARMYKRLMGAQTASPAGSGSELDLELLYRCDETSGPLVNASLATEGGYAGTLSGGVTLITSDAPTGIPPRYITIAENNDPSLGGLPVALHVIRIDEGPFTGDLKVLPGDNVFDQRITLRHSSDFGGDPDPLTFQWYYKPIGADFDPTYLPVVADPRTDLIPGPDLRGWTPYTNFEPLGGAGVNYVTTGEGKESGLITLSDNAFICRYKGYDVDPRTPGAWGGWVGDPSGTADQPRAALAEGWVKRVIRGLNPFDARTTDFHSSPASTFSSMLIQLGQRYEGPISFNPSADAINGVGLIEAYTTVLERARGLSIDGVPQVDFNPANNALLLAATKLSDFYTVLGNEAYADASDPTIGFGSASREYGSIAASIFAFQNQLDSLLEEELGLLRGRDDSAAGVGGRPVYNRLFWNFTLGEGEVAYQQNYNISDQDRNGFIDEKDARILFPQGHGDAWGHYLSALKQHYTLLRHPHFTWVPRSELVNVAGAAVKVDFLDERKFATVAAAKARAGAEIVDLTYRLRYVDDPSGQWQGYKDTKADRAWGVTEWSRRAGLGAYLDWLTGNTILPSTDPNPAHTGIDMIDRQTVRELQEIPAQYDEIQTRLDQADTGLNPLGLAKGIVPFDIDPSLVTASLANFAQTHFEQIQDRALKSMNNASAVWDEVNKATQALRLNQDSVEEFTANVDDKERDFKSRLIEIFGYPYAGDVGAGKTYPGSYDGPDLYHYMYVPVPDFDGQTSPNGPGFTAFFTRMGLGASPVNATGDTLSGAFGSSTESFFFPTDFTSDLTNSIYGLAASNRILAVNYPTTTASYAFAPPASWGQRRAPGELQLALSDVIQTEARLRAALKSDDALLSDIADRVGLLHTRYAVRAEELKLKGDLSNTKIALTTVIIAAKIAQRVLGGMAQTSLRLGDIAADGFPKVVGLATDVTSVGRVTVRLAALAVAEPLEKAGGIIGAVGELTEKVGLEAAQSIVNAKIDVSNFTYEIQKQVDELERVIHQEAASRLEGLRCAEMLRQSTGRYLAALARGQRLLEERVAYRVRVAARTTESRYQDMTFRVFRNDALQKYRATFDLAQRYVFLAATAYDYESNLLGTDSRGGRAFLTDIIRQRALGQMINGSPVVGRAGLADPLARMSGNFDVLKTQLGFNNPQTETGRFSLRNELFRLKDHSDEDWRAQLGMHRVPNLWDIAEFRRYCRSFAPETAGAQPGIVIRFPTTVTAGQNFFQWPLGGGDSAYDSSRFATKIRSAGIWFSGYNGLGLSQTPRIYLVPAGAEVLSSPTANDFVTREWRVVDQALPVPFKIGANRLSDPTWIPVNDSLGGNFAEIRRFASFRAYHDSGQFNPSETISDSRLIGRSVWNKEWVLIIPGQTFLANAGLDAFIASVDDIKLFFQTYSYSGN